VTGPGEPDSNPCQVTVSGLPSVTGCIGLAGVDAEHLGTGPLAWTLEKRSGSPSARWESFCHDHRRFRACPQSPLAAAAASARALANWV